MEMCREEDGRRMQEDPKRDNCFFLRYIDSVYNASAQSIIRSSASVALSLAVVVG